MSSAEAHAAAAEAAYAAAREELHGPMHPEHIDAAIDAYLAALKVAGWKVVPREATEEMLSAGWKEVGAMKQGQHGWKRICADSHRTMHDAAPDWPPEGA